MKELTYVEWKDCAKCRMLKPHVQKWCEKNKINFVEMEYADSWLDISSIPTAILNDWEKDEVLDFEGIVELLQN